MPSNLQTVEKRSGRITPKKGDAPARSRSAAPRPDRWDLNESRSVKTPWVWRGFLMLALLGVGVAIILDANHYGLLAALWLVIAAGWFTTAMFLWRKHNRYMRGT